MSGDEREARLRAIVAEVTRRDVRGVGRDEDLVAALGLDSLAALRVLAAVEKRFGVRLPDERLAQLRTLASLLEQLEQLEETS